MEWYCIRTHNKKERYAAQCIASRLSIKTFAPYISEVRKTRNGRKRFLEAMFPCYVFARFSTEEYLMDVKHSPGVVSVLKQGEEIPAIPGNFIADLRESLDGNDVLNLTEPTPKKNDLVYVNRGPFKNLIGRIIGASNGGERVCVLMDILGRSVDVTMHHSHLSFLEEGAEEARYTGVRFARKSQ